MAPIGENPDQHPQCRFKARWHWLQQQLNFPPEVTPQISCPLFNQWIDLQAVRSLSLIFVSSYMSNPASIYGHNLLKINLEGSGDSHFLLSPTVNFGARVDPKDSPLSYAWKGMLGGYGGRFTDERFYSYSYLYGETELRDLWEYELSLSQEQQYRVIYHLWEMLQNIEFKYYFLNKNCSYRILELLGMAWEHPSLHQPFGLWEMPVEGFYRLLKIENEGVPVVHRIGLIPSRQRRLHAKVDHLNHPLKEWVRRLIQDFAQIDTLAFQQLSANDKAELLDILIDYYRYEESESEQALFKLERQHVLSLRSQLEVPPINEDLESKFFPPTSGSPPFQIRMGAVHHSIQGTQAEIGFWTSFHDLLASEEGQLRNSQLTTLDLRARITLRELNIQQLGLLDVQSLRTSPTVLPLSHQWSWQLKTGWYPRDLECQRCLSFQFLGGFGKATESNELGLLLFGFLNGFLQQDTPHRKGLIYGVTPTFGMMRQASTTWRFEFLWNYWAAVHGEIETPHEFQFNQRWSLSREWDLRLEWHQRHVSEGGLILQSYW